MTDVPYLPAFLDSLLDYLHEHLPPALYLFIVSFLSHTLALLAAFVSLVFSILASKPWEWDAQTIIPPLVTVIAAYLALVSLYRTTSWIVKTTFWFVKWGSIFGLLAAGAGWYTGNADMNDRGGSFLGTVLSMLNGDGGNGGGSRFTATRDGSKRPIKPWESFQNQWQYRESDPTRTLENNAQQIMSDVVAAANRVLVEGGWWDTAKSVFAQSDIRNRKEDHSTKRQGSNRSRR